jgi:hypothetical protein
MAARGIALVLDGFMSGRMSGNSSIPIRLRSPISRLTAAVELLDMAVASGASRYRGPGLYGLGASTFQMAGQMRSGFGRASSPDSDQAELTIGAGGAVTIFCGRPSYARSAAVFPSAPCDPVHTT